MKHYIYFDCDNTMGLPGCDMDDGMALLYLLGRDDVQIEAVTTSFGNNTIDRVHANTERMFRELHLEHIPLKKGGASPEQRESDGSHYLATEIPLRKQRVKLLITGSPTNIYAACLENPEMLTYVDEMIFMGGITEPLIIAGKKMNELNFASDPEATHYLLNCPVKKTIASAQLCLDAFFGEPEMQEVLENQHFPSLAYLKTPLQLWYAFISRQYGVPGFYVWDIVAAAYITHPELFDTNKVCITTSIDDLTRGFLNVEKNQRDNMVTLPTKIQDVSRFWNIVFESWKNVAF